MKFNIEDKKMMHVLQSSILPKLFSSWCKRLSRSSIPMEILLLLTSKITTRSAPVWKRTVSHTMGSTNSNKIVIARESREPRTSLMTAQKNTAPIILMLCYTKYCMQHDPLILKDKKLYSSSNHFSMFFCFLAQIPIDSILQALPLYCLEGVGVINQDWRGSLILLQIHSKKKLIVPPYILPSLLSCLLQQSCTFIFPSDVSTVLLFYRIFPIEMITFLLNVHFPQISCMHKMVVIESGQLIRYWHGNIQFLCQDELFIGAWNARW